MNQRTTPPTQMKPSKPPRYMAIVPPGAMNPECPKTVSVSTACSNPKKDTQPGKPGKHSLFLVKEDIAAVIRLCEHLLEPDGGYTGDAPANWRMPDP